jgi:hypothetical protein
MARRKIDAPPKAKIAPEAMWGTPDLPSAIRFDRQTNRPAAHGRYGRRAIQFSTRAQIANFDILIPLS